MKIKLVLKKEVKLVIVSLVVVSLLMVAINKCNEQPTKTIEEVQIHYTTNGEWYVD